MDEKKMLRTLVVEVPLGLHREDSEVITAEALEQELPNATLIEIPLWNLDGDSPCTGHVQDHFANGRGMMIMLNYHLRPGENDLNKISPRYKKILGITRYGRGHIFVPADGKLTWGDLRKILQKHQTILYHRIIHSDG